MRAAAAGRFPETLTYIIVVILYEYNITTEAVAPRSRRVIGWFRTSFEGGEAPMPLMRRRIAGILYLICRFVIKTRTRLTY